MIKKKSIWTKQKKDEVKRCFRGWVASSGMVFTKIYYEFHEEEEAIEDSNGTTTFSIVCGTPYKWITLHAYPPVLESDYDLDVMETDLCHELIHTILDPMCKNRMLADKLFTYHLEETTEFLAAWIMAMTWHYRDLKKRKRKPVDRKKKKRKNR